MDRGFGIYEIETDELARFVPCDLNGDERARLLSGLYGATDLDQYYLLDTDDAEGASPGAAPSGRPDPLELERAGWEALSSTPERAMAFYDRVLADEVLMLLSGGLVLDEHAAAVQAMGGPTWSSFELHDERAVALHPDVTVVAYRALATRGDVEVEALCSSTYVWDGADWRLALHQQTPR